MSAKENGTPDQEGAAHLQLDVQVNTLGDGSQDANRQFLKAVHEIDMNQFMPTAGIERGRRGNPLWGLAGRVRTLALVFSPDPDYLDQLVYAPRSCKDDLIFSRWFEVYPQHCRETGIAPDSEEDLWMMWSNAVVNRVQPENGVKLAADLARRQPLPNDALLFEESPKLQLIVATLITLARITEQGGWIAFTHAQLGDAIGESGQTIGDYINKLLRSRYPLLWRTKTGKPKEPSEYVLLSETVFRWEALPDAIKAQICACPSSKLPSGLRNLLDSAL